MLLVFVSAHMLFQHTVVFCSSGFFIRPFYKMMLGKQISLKDMESVVRAHCYLLFKILFWAITLA